MPEHTAGVNDVVKMFYTGKQARAEGQPPEAAGTYVGHVVAGRAEPGHVKVQWTGYEAAEGLEACNYKESRPVALLQVLQKGDPDGRYKKPVDYVYVMEEAAHERAISRSERRASSRGRERTAPHWVHEVPLHRLGSCSTRDRIIVNRGFSLPELSEEPRPMSDALKGEQGTMDGLAIIGTAAAGRAKRLGEGPMRPLDGSGGSAHTVYNEGGPLVVLEDGSRERICSRPDIGLALLGDGDTAWVDENMAVFNSKEFKEARLRNSESSPVRYIEPSAPLPAILKLQRAAIEQNGAQKKKKIHLSICGGALDAGKEAARRDPLHHKSITYEAKETCRIFQTVRDKLRGETGKHIVKDVVFGDKGEFHELDIGDGEGKTLHEGCGWAEALEMIKCDLDEARGDLRRKDVFIYVDASPPCNGICFVNSGPGFADRRQEGIKLTKDIHEKLLEPLWKENAIDAYVLENTHDCIFEW